MKEIRQFEKIWGDNGVMSLLTQKVGDSDELQGREQPGKTMKFFHRDVTTRGTREYTWDMENHNIAFDISVPMKDINLEGSINSQGKLEATCTDCAGKKQLFSIEAAA